MVLVSLERDEAAERDVIELDFSMATEFFQSYVIKVLIMPILSQIEIDRREDIELEELTDIASLVAGIHLPQKSEKVHLPVIVKGWEETRVKIAIRERNCFNYLVGQYLCATELAVRATDAERMTRITITSFWWRGLQILFAQFAQQWKCLSFFEELQNLVLEVESSEYKPKPIYEIL